MVIKFIYRKLCVKKQRYKFCKCNGPEGLVLFSVSRQTLNCIAAIYVLLQKHPDRIGTVQTDYYGFSKNIVLGGYRRVYKVVLQKEPVREIAIKEVTDTNADVMLYFVHLCFH